MRVCAIYHSSPAHRCLPQYNDIDHLQIQLQRKTLCSSCANLAFNENDIAETFISAQHSFIYYYFVRSHVD